MNFLRLFVVVCAVTLCGGVFGAAVGGLIGFAAPGFLTVVFGVEHHQSHGDAARLDHAAQQTRTTVGLQPRHQEGMPLYGAAIGGATGLIVGAIVALALGVIDQVLLFIARGRASRAAAAASPPGAPHG